MEAEGKLVVKELDIDKYQFSRDENSLHAINQTEPQFGNQFQDLTNNKYELYQSKIRHYYYIFQLTNTQLIGNLSYFRLNNEEVTLYIDIDVRINGVVRTLNFPLPVDADDSIPTLGVVEISDPDDSEFKTNLASFSLDIDNGNAVLFSNLLDNTYCDKLKIKAMISYKKKI